jgi:hypothetical protein
MLARLCAEMEKKDAVLYGEDVNYKLKKERTGFLLFLIYFPVELKTPFRGRNCFTCSSLEASICISGQ